MTFIRFNKRALRMTVAAFSQQGWYPDTPPKSSGASAGVGGESS
ncbi:MAG: hypothetical protein NT022_09945 [Deltaproteobacteria bacterium]|nr:hypothetical protein [Deltaproteobacteria bacterium]